MSASSAAAFAELLEWVILSFFSSRRCGAVWRVVCVRAKARTRSGLARIADVETGHAPLGVAPGRQCSAATAHSDAGRSSHSAVRCWTHKALNRVADRPRNGVLHKQAKFSLAPRTGRTHLARRLFSRLFSRVPGVPATAARDNVSLDAGDRTTLP